MRNLLPCVRRRRSADCRALQAAPVPSVLLLRRSTPSFQQKPCGVGRQRLQLVVIEVLELLPEAFPLCQHSNSTLLSR